MTQRTQRTGPVWSPASWLLVTALSVAAHFFASPASAQNGPPEVSVARPAVQSIVDYDIYTGRTRALQDVEIRARVSGFLEAIVFEEGMIVEVGAVLFQLDTRQAETEVARLEARLSEVESALALTEIEYARILELRQRQSAAQQQLDEAEALRASARAVVQGVAAELQAARITLSDATVRAPFTGRIGASEVDIGTLIDGGSAQGTLLTTLASIDPVEIVFDAPEADYLTYVRLGLVGEAASSRTAPAEIRVRLADEADWIHPGRITFIDNRLDPNTGTIRLHATIPNPQELFLPGLFGEVRVPRRGPYDALLIPDTAVLTDLAGRVVYVVAEDDTVEARPVETGQRIGDMRVIRDGITSEDRVILSGFLTLGPGAAVIPRETDLTADAKATR